MNDDMTIQAEKVGTASILAPKGDVDLSRSRQAQAAKPSKLVVDLAGVEYMDSSGVATLVEALQIARKNNTKVVLCDLKDKVRSIFEIARLDTVFTIVGSRDEALKA